MKDVADYIVPDLSGRKKAAAEKAAADKKAAEDAAAAAAEAERAKAAAKVNSITFKKGGKIDGIAQRGKTRGRMI
jgi:membrane protein involved in colicin uptake